MLSPLKKLPENSLQNLASYITSRVLIKVLEKEVEDTGVCSTKNLLCSCFDEIEEKTFLCLLHY